MDKELKKLLGEAEGHFYYLRRIDIKYIKSLIRQSYYEGKIKAHKDYSDILKQ